MVYLSIGVVYKQRGLVLAVAGAKPVPIITYQLPLASATQRRAAAVFSGRLADKIVLATSKECRIKALGKIDSGIKIMRIGLSKCGHFLQYMGDEDISMYIMFFQKYKRYSNTTIHFMSKNFPL